MKKKKNNDKSNYNNFQAKVDIVTKPDNIMYYSHDRSDYTELATIAIKQKPSVIKFVSLIHQDYPNLCQLACREKLRSFLLIDDRVSNYKELGCEVISSNPYIVDELKKDSKYYFLFWEFAISMCYKVLGLVGKDRDELFPLLEKAIRKEPLAIFYVDSRISIYNLLCNIAYSLNKESLLYMNINCIDANLVFEYIRKKPEYIRFLDPYKDFYFEACKIALSMDGKLIDYLYFPNEQENLDSYFELVDIALSNAPEMIDCSSVLEALWLENRRRKQALLNTPNILGDNLYKLLEEIDNEYEELYKQYIKAKHARYNCNQPIESDIISECPIKRKLKRNII